MHTWNKVTVKVLLKVKFSEVEAIKMRGGSYERKNRYIYVHERRCRRITQLLKYSRFFG